MPRRLPDPIFQPTPTPLDPLKPPLLEPKMVQKSMMSLNKTHHKSSLHAETLSRPDVPGHIDPRYPFQTPLQDPTLNPEPQFKMSPTPYFPPPPAFLCSLDAPVFTCYHTSDEPRRFDDSTLVNTNNSMANLSITTFQSSQYAPSRKHPGRLLLHVLDSRNHQRTWIGRPWLDSRNHQRTWIGRGYPHFGPIPARPYSPEPSLFE